VLRGERGQLLLRRVPKRRLSRRQENQRANAGIPMPRPSAKRWDLLAEKGPGLLPGPRRLQEVLHQQLRGLPFGVKLAQLHHRRRLLRHRLLDEGRHPKNVGDRTAHDLNPTERRNDVISFINLASIFDLILLTEIVRFLLKKNLYS
jgi:hypothetical protein